MNHLAECVERYRLTLEVVIKAQEDLKKVQEKHEKARLAFMDAKDALRGAERDAREGVYTSNLQMV